MIGEDHANSSFYLILCIYEVCMYGVVDTAVLHKPLDHSTPRPSPKICSKLVYIYMEPTHTTPPVHELMLHV